MYYYFLQNKDELDFACDCIFTAIWMFPIKSELTPIIFYMKVTHLGSEASIWLSYFINACSYQFIFKNAFYLKFSIFLNLE